MAARSIAQRKFAHIADYKGDSVEISDAADMVETAEAFVAAMRAEFIPEPRRDHNGMAH